MRNNMNLSIYSYKFGSESAKKLAETLKVKRIRHKNSKFKGSDKKTVINWGSSELPAEVGMCKVLNKPVCVYNASRKSRAFMFMGHRGVNVPEYTWDKQEATSWIEGGSVVFSRTTEKGKDGEGIVVCQKVEELVDDAMYVKYIPKKEEWRIHVAFGKVIDFQKKLSRGQAEDFFVRNHGNGFIFRRYGIKPPAPEVLIEAVRATDALGLDFAGLDVIWNEKRHKAYVLEANTAPGIEGSTVDSYAEVFKDYMRG